MANSWIDDAEQALQKVSDHQYNALRLFIKVEPEDAQNQLVWAGASNTAGMGDADGAELGTDSRRGSTDRAYD